MCHSILEEMKHRSVLEAMGLISEFVLEDGDFQVGFSENDSEENDDDLLNVPFTMLEETANFIKMHDAYHSAYRPNFLKNKFEHIFNKEGVYEYAGDIFDGEQVGACMHIEYVVGFLHYLASLNPSRSTIWLIQLASWFGWESPEAKFTLVLDRLVWNVGAAMEGLFHAERYDDEELLIEIRPLLRSLSQQSQALSRRLEFANIIGPDYFEDEELSTADMLDIFANWSHVLWG